MPTTTSNGSGGESMCALHEARIAGIEDEIGGLTEAVHGLGEKIDALTDPADSLREVLSSHEFASTGYGAVVEAARSTAELAINRGVELGMSRTGSILALVLLTGSVAGSGLALRTEWGAIESAAAAASNVDADTSPPALDE